MAISYYFVMHELSQICENINCINRINICAKICQNKLWLQKLTMKIAALPNVDNYHSI